MYNPYITHGSSKIGGGLISNWISGWWFGCHFLFSHILGISSSQLTVIFFRGVAQPPTRYGSFGVSCWFLLVGRSCRIWKPKVSKSDHHPTAKKWQESPGGLFSDAFGAPESWVGEALDEWVTIFDPDSIQCDPLLSQNHWKICVIWYGFQDPNRSQEAVVSVFEIPQIDKWPQMGGTWQVLLPFET